MHGSEASRKDLPVLRSCIPVRQASESTSLFKLSGEVLPVRKNKIRLAAAACLLALLLTGCHGLFEKEYRFEEVYEEEYAAVRRDSSVQEVRNYSGMKNALLNMIAFASEYGIIRTTKYNGTVEDDISKACFEVTRETPLGLYAVEYISHSVSRILSYYEISVSISYKHTAEEIAAIRTVHTGRELQELLTEALTAIDDELTVMQVSTEFSVDEIRSFAEQAYRSDPLAIPAKPEVGVNIYSSAAGVQRITEIRLDYPLPTAELARRPEALQIWCDTYFKDREGLDALQLCRDTCLLLHPFGSADTVFDALMGSGSASDEGFAMVMKLFCEYSGVECYVVSGLRDEREHYWNIVEWEGNYYHLDAVEAAINGGEPALLSDRQMLSLYRWDTSRYPACETELPSQPAEPEEKPFHPPKVEQA